MLNFITYYEGNWNILKTMGTPEVLRTKLLSYIIASQYWEYIFEFVLSKNNSFDRKIMNSFSVGSDV